MSSKSEKFENLRKWIAALESGKYHPERGVMSSNCGFCTVGVARALRVVEAARKWGDKNAEPYEYMVLEQAIEEWEAGR